MAVALIGWTACGGGGNGDRDANPAVGLCEGGTLASTDDFLPSAVGNVWRYRVTDGATGAVTVKRQELTEEITPPEIGEPVIVQVTIKSTGRTESWLQRQGDALVRVRQQDFDEQNTLERTTEYMPSKIRLDETADRIAAGAGFSETYTQTVTDILGVETVTEVTDEWSVLGVDEPCSTPLGELECLHLSRRRVAGGIADKEFFFARGYGKILETGGQTEELIECDLQ